MSTTHPLFQEAIMFANGALERKARAKKEKLNIEDRIAELELKIRFEQEAADRLRTFAVEKDGRLQCPQCWIIQEVRTDLSAVASDNRDDKFRCPSCHFEFVRYA